MAKNNLSLRHRLGRFELVRHRVLYLMVLPAFLYVLIYGYLTLPYLVIAFEKYNFRTGLLSQWIGLKNFEHFFRSTWAWTVTRNTIVMNLLFIVVVYTCSITLALLLNEIRSRRFVKVSQSLILLPYFISWVIISYMVYGVLNSDTGALNKLMLRIGLVDRAVQYYSQANYWYVILVILRVWKYVGWTSIIFLSAITGIDSSMYEAAYIDGANRWKCTRYLTLPLLMPTLSVLVLIEIGRIFYGDFGMFYAVIKDNGALMPVTEVIDTYVFRTFKRTGQPSLSMAVGLYQSVVGFILVFTTNMLVRRYYPDGSLF